MLFFCYSITIVVAGGILLLELNRVLRPGGYFVWSATPVYQKLKEDVGIWKGNIDIIINMFFPLLIFIAGFCFS